MPFPPLRQYDSHIKAIQKLTSQPARLATSKATATVRVRGTVDQNNRHSRPVGPTAAYMTHILANSDWQFVIPGRFLWSLCFRTDRVETVAPVRLFRFFNPSVLSCRSACHRIDDNTMPIVRRLSTNPDPFGIAPLSNLPTFAPPVMAVQTFTKETVVAESTLRVFWTTYPTTNY